MVAVAQFISLQMSAQRKMVHTTISALFSFAEQIKVKFISIHVNFTHASI